MVMAAVIVGIGVSSVTVDEGVGSVVGSIVSAAVMVGVGLGSVAIESVVAFGVTGGSVGADVLLAICFTSATRSVTGGRAPSFVGVPISYMTR